jgi:hypothetical protein
MRLVVAIIASYILLGHRAASVSWSQASFLMSRSHRAKRAVVAPTFAWGDDPMRGVNIGGW